jgi:hypothetical protein
MSAAGFLSSRLPTSTSESRRRCALSRHGAADAAENGDFPGSYPGSPAQTRPEEVSRRRHDWLCCQRKISRYVHDAVFIPRVSWDTPIKER